MNKINIRQLAASTLLWLAASIVVGLAASAANAQLSAPVIAALAGVVLFAEPITLRLSVASVLVLGGTALAVRGRLAFNAARVASGR